MPINVTADERRFHLHNDAVSMVLTVDDEGVLEQAYWGAAIGDAHLDGIDADRRGAHLTFNVDQERYAIAYPGHGTGDQRSPAYHVAADDGHRASELRYRSHRIEPGKPPLDGLPATYVEAEDEADTLVLTLEDVRQGLRVELFYTLFADHAAIAQHAELHAIGDAPLRVERAMSACAAFPERDWHMLRLAGAWGRERGVEVAPLAHGLQAIESRRGASGHQLNPFFALTEHGASEEHGAVYGFSLVYSGNHLGQVEVAADYTARALIGLGSFDFAWTLAPGERFTTPEAVLVFSPAGLGPMSRTYHRLYRTRLCRGAWRDRTRPVLINNWEATYFDFTPDKLVAIAREAAAIGVELFVLDDGWFGKRDDDRSGLGDWVVNEDKLPGGLDALARRIGEEGLRFGLWFEPEMVSPDSDLYRAHPDWCLHIPDRRRSVSRHQLVLDLSRDEVCEYVIDSLSAILSSAPIDYVKWDFNRNLSEIGSGALDADRQRELPHRYMLGLYRILETLTRRFDHILWESCSGGGGRFDPGMLHYMPQTWTSDNTDAVSRLKIQYGSSLVYPLSSLGAHVSAVPNHQVERSTPVNARAYAALFGTFGYELDLTTEDEASKRAGAAHIALFKRHAALIHGGDLHRLQSPFVTGAHPEAAHNETSWIVVAPDGEAALLFWHRVLQVPNPGRRLLPLRGLDPDAAYRVAAADDPDTAVTRTGAYLMHAGWPLPHEITGDFHARVWELTRV